MTRRSLLAASTFGVVLALAPGLVTAQDTPDAPAPATEPAAPASFALRVTLDLSSQVDNEPEPANTFQYYLFERLSHFGVRVDSLKPVGQERFDTWIQRRVARWEKQEPGAPAASLAISGSAGCTYKNAEFFGQGQAHNFQGRVDVSLKDASGAELAQVSFEHSWGRLPTRHTRSQVLQEYNDMVFTGVLLALLHQPQVWSGIPEAKREELRTWTEQQKARLLGPLEANMADCELAALLKGLQAPG